MRDWQQALNALYDRHEKLGHDQLDYAKANASAVQRSAKGQGPDYDDRLEGAGVRMVANMASAHIPAFCNDGYKNGYDLGKYRIGQGSGRPPRLRERVDSALPVADASDVCFGAVAINGSGIRFYGDICLVLEERMVNDDTILLDRNSYDLVREPLCDRITDTISIQNLAEELVGEWRDVGLMAAVKVVSASGPRSRRLTAGQISDGVLDDEDYIEVLLPGRFGAGDLQEARIAASEVAVATNTESRLDVGPPPSLSELILLDQRRRAANALANVGVEFCVVTTSGRTK